MTQYIPRPHQKEAVEAATKAFKKSDRVTETLPCGTGKTLISAWIAASLEASKIVIFEPSLWLIRQTYLEWKSLEYFKDFEFIAICSDEHLFDDLKIEELEIPVISNAQDLKREIEQPKNKKRVFLSTYHSTHTIRDAITAKNQFDFGFFDEAHCTAGVGDTRFSMGLMDSIVPIKKRLFMTATPRMVDVRKPKIRGQLFEVFSMSNEKIYGPICFEMSLSEAIKRQLVTDYKIVVSVITKQDISREQIREGELNGINAEDVAAAIALENATHQFKLNKVIAFFHRIEQSKTFTEITAKQYIKGFESHHISSEVKKNQRAVIMKSLSDQDKTIVSNARCLTMGVNVPTVDAVAFMKSKSGDIDIIQALGRAIRKDEKNPNKQGVIFLPIFLDDYSHESAETVIQESSFEALWSVLSSLKEQDSVLESWISLSRGELGLNPNYNIAHFDKLEVTSNIKEIDSEILKNAIESRAIERLGESWDEFYKRLLIFKAKNGHCNVNYNDPDQQLYIWAKWQRRRKQLKKITPKHMEKLTAIGFQFKINDSDLAFDELIKDLIEYKKDHGTANVPETDKENKSLYARLKHIRARYSSGKMDAEKIERLNEIGVSLSPIIESNLNKIKEIIRHYKKTKSFEAHSKSEVYNHMKYFRARYKANKLEPYVIKALNEINFPMHVKSKSEIAFEKNIESLKLALAKSEPLVHGDSNHNFTRRMQKKYKEGKLKESEKKALKEAGYDVEKNRFLI